MLSHAMWALFWRILIQNWRQNIQCVPEKTEPWNNGMLQASFGVYDYYHIHFMKYDYAFEWYIRHVFSHTRHFQLSIKCDHVSLRWIWCHRIGQNMAFFFVRLLGRSCMVNDFIKKKLKRNAFAVTSGATNFSSGNKVFQNVLNSIL